jgi:non-heme chloroperoxidase
VGYIEVEKGVRIFVNDLNPCNGETVLFLHGWPSSHKMFEYQFNHLFASKLSNEFKTWFNGLALEASGHATAMTAISLRDEDLREDAQRIFVPTGIFHGIHDQIVPFPSAEEMHHYIEGSMLIPFEYSSHGLFYDELDRFNYCLMKFLRM